MSYFPNAFKKVFVGTSFVTTGKTEDLTVGQFGFFNAKTWAAIPVVNANVTANPQVVFAMGGYHTADKVGAHGGYKESIKSQIITPGRIHRFWKASAQEPISQVIYLGWSGASDAIAPKFLCGQTYHLRIDLKGSPALRLMDHNLYNIFSVSTACCTNIVTPEAVDPIAVIVEFAKQINEDPIFSKFIKAYAIDWNTLDNIDPDEYEPLTNSGDIDAALATLVLEGAYVDTKFGNCSFDPRDYFEVEPVVVSSAQLIDDTGSPCPIFTQLAFTQIRAAQMPDGTSNKVLRDLILFNNYRQEPYQFNARMRETEDMNGLFTEVPRGTEIYDSFYILHSVDRKYNPTGVYDNDLYLIQLSVPHGTSTTNFETWVNNYLSSASTGVTLEDLSSLAS
jgi:hypothetical protein